MKGIGPIEEQDYMHLFAYQLIIFLLFSLPKALLLSSYGKYH